MDRWSAPYRGWHYWPDPVIPAEPKIPGHEAFHNTDVPCVYQLPGQPDKWYMSFIAFNGQGYNSFVAESNDLIHWSNPRLAMGFGKPGEFDHGGCVIGAYLYDSYDIHAPRVLKRRDGKFWTLYGCYPKQGGYEMRPGYEGVATSDDGLTWRRAKDQPILSVHDPDCGAWEKSCIYQPWLVEHEGRFYDFYNAAHGGSGADRPGHLDRPAELEAVSRQPGRPRRPSGYDEEFASDPKVFRDGDHWVMFYFGVGRGGAHVMAAFSRDLLHWTAHPEPLYKAGGHPGGLDKPYAHKISLVYNPKNETFYMYYCATGNKGRCIGLITSKPPTKAEPAGRRAVDSPAPEHPADILDDATGPRKPRRYRPAILRRKEGVAMLPGSPAPRSPMRCICRRTGSAGRRFPVLMDLWQRPPGQGPRRFGFGISGGKGFIWAVLPYVGLDHKQDMDLWWGDVDATSHMPRRRSQRF